MVTVSDYFCGAGGSSSGLVAAGFEVTHAANHWARAIETHQLNHPHTEHSLDDLMQAHPSWYPKTDVAWFSPECTNHSLAKGKRRKSASQMDLWGQTNLTPEEIRSRATMREVVEFSAWHGYKVVIVENVVDIRYWEHFDEWLGDMIKLDYDYRLLYLNAMFFGVPQSRDRFYAIFWKRGVRAPALEFRPSAVCLEHGVVNAVQTFKKEAHWGRYGDRRQYVYRCPHCGAILTPGHVPAAAVIDWSIPNQRIADRARPLKPRTEERILAGLRKFGYSAHVADLAYSHAGDEGKVSHLANPLPTQTARQTLALCQPFLTAQHDGRNPLRAIDEPLWAVTGMNNEQQLVVPPFIAVMKHSYSPDGTYTLPPRALDEPLTTIVATSSQHALVQPFIAELKGGMDARSTADPLSTITAGVISHALVMSYYGGNAVHTSTDEPLPTQRTVAHQALLTPEELLPECGFRMLEPEELKLGMSFAGSYVITGNKREQVRQIGNAVCCNVAQWIGERVMEALQ